MCSSVLDQMESPSVPNQSTGSASVRGGVAKEYQERLKKLTEAQRKIQEEKKKIVDQVRNRHIVPATLFKVLLVHR